MIDFHLDARSRVAPYAQLAQQVRRALRLGMLSVGDQLPTVKDVVAKVAINPNTVLKAYRELEHEGLVSATTGRGNLRDRYSRGRDSLAAHEPLRKRAGAVAGQSPVGPDSTRKALKPCS